ncbi:ADP-ribosyltransferase, partial [Streptomyces sp. 4N509B]|uniref:ADP-ribosyltransferase n=1 Tax=Streptomyces sp. 4N509B TaxID=3457413 RepID=UPI003FD56057
VATGAAARTASTAARAATHAGRALDPMTHVARGTSAAFSALRLPDLTAHLAAINAIDATRLPDNAGYRLPDSTTIPPNPTLDDLPLGTATLRLDDSTILIPHNPEDLVPEGAVLDPETGELLLPNGVIANSDGIVVRYQDAPAEPYANYPDRPGVVSDELNHAAAHADRSSQRYSAHTERITNGRTAEAENRTTAAGEGGANGFHSGGPVSGDPWDSPGDQSAVSRDHGAAPPSREAEVGHGSLPAGTWEELTPEEQFLVAEAEIRNGAVSFVDNHDAMRYGAAHWNEYADNLPHAQRQAVHDYTVEPPHPQGRPTYQDINGFLRGNEALGTPHVLDDIARIDEVMSGNPLPEDVIVVRGTGLGHYDVEPIDMMGETFTDASYMSTSLGDPASAFAGREAVLHLRVPAGTPALWVERLSAFGAGERELLLGRGLSYEVTRAFQYNGQWQIYAVVKPV